MSELLVNTIKKADGTGSLTVPAESGTVVTTASPSLGRRNLIINGAMQVAQRGTASSSTGYQTVDRWRLNLGTQQEQKTDAPDQFKNSMEVTGTVAGSSGYGILLQRIESNNIYAALGQSCTLSCYVKNTGTSTANVSVEVYRANTTDNFGAITLVSSLTSQAITTGWTRITFPAFTVPTTASTGLEVRIFRYDASNDQEWQITGVQLEVGSVATPFEHRSYGEELALCQRYFVRGDFHTSGISNFSGAVHYFFIPVQFPVPMRASPAATNNGTIKLYSWSSETAIASGNINSYTHNRSGVTTEPVYSTKVTFNATSANAPAPVNGPGTGAVHPMSILDGSFDAEL